MLSVGCSHGTFANPDALRAVLRFRDEWKPKHRIHLGDALVAQANGSYSVFVPRPRSA